VFAITAAVASVDLLQVLRIDRKCTPPPASRSRMLTESTRFFV
jgi:hypothetical protein